MLVLISLAKQGEGIAFLPDVYVQNELGNGSLVEVLSDFRPESLPINLLCVFKRLLTHLLKAFTEYVVTHFSSAMPTLAIEVKYLQVRQQLCFVTLLRRHYDFIRAP